MCVCACEAVGVLLVTLVCIRKDGEGLAKEIHVCVCEVVGVLLVTQVCIRKDGEGLVKEIHVCVCVCARWWGSCW